MQRRARDLVQIVDGFGRLGLPHLRSRLARRRADAWAASVIQEVRSGRRRPPTGSVADVMAFARDPAGELLPLRTAAVELLNVLRPTVAVSYFVVFAARQLEANPDLNDACAAGNPDMVRMFSEEVRRLSPFVPVIGARSRCPFAWNGHRVRTGDRLRARRLRDQPRPGELARRGDLRPEPVPGARPAQPAGLHPPGRRTRGHRAPLPRRGHHPLGARADDPARWPGSTGGSIRTTRRCR